MAESGSAGREKRGMKKLWRFGGGVKLSGHKTVSDPAKVQRAPLPKRLYLPLRQHIGAPAEPVVEVGSYVYKGQVLAVSSAFVSAPVHAPSSGTVIAIEKHTMPHQSGIAEECAVIETDGADRWHPDIAPLPRPGLLSADELRARIREAGIVGLGGAVFPSAAKLKPPRAIDTLILNGVECEPYITCDDALMRSRPEEIVRGLLLVQRVVESAECIIAVEDNKPEAIARMRDAVEKLRASGVGGSDAIEVVAVPTRFPAGGEKQLIKVLTGKEVPQGGLPYEIGIVCLNVGTTAAVYDAVYEGRPLVARIMTVTGPQIRQPANFEVLIGTPVQDMLDAAGGVVSDAHTLIMGGPMMGTRLPHGQVPVVKASNCILVENAALADRQPAMPCIRCGTCATVCPINLLPQQLYWHARGKAYDKLDRHHLADCIECGCCAVVCPSRIPLVQYFRYAKTEKAAQEARDAFADQSRVRMQLREARLARLAREQEERKAKRKAARLGKKKTKVPIDQAGPATREMAGEAREVVA